MKDYPKTKLTIVLVLFFCVPFLVKTLSPKLEIFPAPIFPSGSSKFEIEQKPELHFNALYGIDSTTQERKKLNKYTFFKTIPIHYFNFLANKDFGLKPKKNKEKIDFFGFQIAKENKVSSIDIAKSKKWVINLLKEQGCIDSIFIIERKKVSIDMETKRVKNSTVINEEVIHLF